LLSLQDDLFSINSLEQQAIQMQPERSIDCFGLLCGASFSVANNSRDRCKDSDEDNYESDSTQ
jgi:hypothetical protein